MAECVLMKSGGGADLDAVTAAAADVVAPKVIVGPDGEPVTGTMVDRGNWNSTELVAGASVTIPAGRHGGGGKVTAKSLAAQTGGATATDQYVKSGMTYWKDGVKRTGTMTVSSVVSFSVAPYSTSQVIATWKNPGKGPYGHFTIGAKKGRYPTSAADSDKVWSGAGSNSAINAQNSAIVSGLEAGQLYYFSIWTECDCSGGWMTSSPLHATCTPTAHGRAAFTSSGTWIVPANVRSINIHCTGGGGGGAWGVKEATGDWDSGGGGGGGYTAYKNGITVSPGQQIVCNVGNGGAFMKDGQESSASLNGSKLVSASGGKGTAPYAAYDNAIGRDGGSGGGGGITDTYRGNLGGGGGSDGGNGTNWHTNTHVYKQGSGQGTTTKEFGTGTLYGGGGGGGSMNQPNSPGGAGGGGTGGSRTGSIPGGNGSAGTGGGAGGGGYETNTVDKPYTYGGTGGSGNVIITW